MDHGFPELGGFTTLRDGAREAGVSYSTARSWVKSGKLKAGKVGRDFLVRREDLAWLGAQSRRFYRGQKWGGKVSAARQAAGKAGATAS